MKAYLVTVVASVVKSYELEAEDVNYAEVEALKLFSEAVDNDFDEVQRIETQFIG